MPDSRSTDALSGVHKLYGEIWAQVDAEFDAEISRSRQPRSPEVLFDYAASLDIDAGALVLDIGSRDAIHAIEMASRFDWRVIAADPVPVHADLARECLQRADPEVAARIDLSDAAIEHLPFGDASFDLIWARDMLNHVALRLGLKESFRVLKPGGAMLVFQTFATPLLEPGEARRLYENHSIFPENMDPEHLEEVAQAVGFVVETQDVVSSEWREYGNESGKEDAGQDLLTIARMHRAEHELVSTYGRPRYEATIASKLWNVYLLLGKLSSSIYIFRKPAPQGSTNAR